MPGISPRGSLQRLCSPLLRLAARLIGRESAWERREDARPAWSVRAGIRSSRSHSTSKARARCASHPSTTSWRGCRPASTSATSSCSRSGTSGSTPAPSRPAGAATAKTLRCGRGASWRELGIDAEFCVGRVVSTDQTGRRYQHAWVVYRIDGTAFLLEPAARTPARTIRLLADAMGQYVPHFAVNHRFETHAFVGCADESRRIGGNRDDPALAL